MSAPADVAVVVRQWVSKAENDLRNATHTLSLGEDCPYDTVCFHAQQCAEKYVKALLTHRGVPFPKVHDIGELIALLPPGFVLPLSADEQEILTDFATTSRYPGEPETPTRREAEEAVALAIGVRDAARTLLPVDALGR